MNLITYCILALAFFLMPAWGEPVRLSNTAPQPWGREILKDPATVSFRLNKLLQEGRLEEFYDSARKELDAADNKQDEDTPFSEQEYLDWLWMMYFITAAPSMETDYTPDDPGPHSIADDRDAKFISLMQTGLGTNSDPDYLNYTKKHRRELMHLFASYSAEVLRKTRESYDPDLAPKLKKMKFQPDDNADAETNKRNYIFFTNKQIRRDTRNDLLPSRIKSLEKILMSNLWNYFHGQAREVEKYIKLAGYQSEEEIDELIFRTVGRTPQMEFLYQGDRGKRYERKIRSGKESHVNDRYLHPLIRAVKERERQAKERKEAGKRS